MKKKSRAVKYPRGFERKFSKALEDMVGLMVQQYENETLKKLNKKTIEKFEDAQKGNYANIFKSLDKKARRKILKRFSDKRIKKLVTKILKSLNRQNQSQLYGNLEDDLGIPVNQLIAQEGLTPSINAAIAETEQWALRLRDETLLDFTANTLRSMALGKPFDEVVNEYKELGSKRKNHAKFIARNQLANYNTFLNKMRYEKLGIEKARWVTARDERVRPSHEDRDGKIFDVKTGLKSSLDGKTLLPGIDYNCRCIAEPIIPGEEEL